MKSYTKNIHICMETAHYIAYIYNGNMHIKQYKEEKKKEISRKTYFNELFRSLRCSINFVCIAKFFKKKKFQNLLSFEQVSCFQEVLVTA